MINYSFSMDELEYFMLIFCRVSCLIYVVPFFSMNNTPRRFRVGLAFVVTLLLYYVLPQKTSLVYDTLLEYTLSNGKGYVCYSRYRILDKKLTKE